MFKKIGLALLATAMIFSASYAPSYADGEDSRAVIGADLTDEQLDEVYEYFGISRGSATELTVTNDEEHYYLSWLVSDEQLGTRAISCAYITLLDDGSGIDVSLHNIDWVTAEMYQGALLTAGIYDADIIIAAPFDVSGTAGLLGIYKAYEDITGTSLDELAKQAGLQELFVAGNLSDFVGSDSATYLITQLKLILDQTATMSDDELKAQIEAIAEAQNIDTSEIDIDQVVALVRTLEGLDVPELQSRILQFTETFDTVKESTSGVRTFFEAVDAFFAPVGTLFDKLGEWLSNLFS